MAISIRTLLKMALLGILVIALAGCDDDETYGDKKKKERKIIHDFITNGSRINDTLTIAPINVIDEATFAAQDSTTRLDDNQYVLLSKTGVYMQIINKGDGESIKEDENVTIYCRYLEYNLSTDTVQSTNNNLYYIAVPDILTCNNSYGTYTASFISGVMMNTYSTSSVPEGWLVALPYIHLGRRQDNLAKVRLIVPHSSGQSDAQSYVYSCFYEISYQRGR
ncbi:MAG: DUF4827 domain-containing protein [Prevotellaceae bacterium]|nr:DUF4827 domain-containing protein [Prevotellaceae bacterium]